ncbi:MAG: heavy metal-binding domain-containing protein [Sediminibacterium sp.]|nr:heavy metal-binding domain-containing protein [Sediminibacterium sp.]
MKTNKMGLMALTVTILMFTGISAMGQNKSVTDTTKQDTVIYTCTMHPEIKFNQPGKCPKCGMDLVKKTGVSGNKKHKMKMMHQMMNGMSDRSGMENMENNNSAEMNKTATDSTQKDAALYTCSMHPEIQSNQPGSCPKCGMTLIKKSDASGKNDKHHKMSSMGMGMGMGIGMGIMMAGMLLFLIIR